MAIEISHPDKVLFPEDGITKAELVHYYRQIGPVMLKHIRDRPLMMQCYPDGIHRDGFIQQQIPDYFPDWIQRVTVPKERGTVTHAVCNNIASLVYLANQACITLHAWLSRADRLEYPDQMIFDLDPADDDFDKVRSSALGLRELLDELGLASFVKTTGLFGAHVVVPLDRSATFDEVRGSRATSQRSWYDEIHSSAPLRCVRRSVVPGCWSTLCAMPMARQQWRPMLFAPSLERRWPCPWPGETSSGEQSVRGRSPSAMSATTSIPMATRGVAWRGELVPYGMRVGAWQANRLSRPLVHWATLAAFFASLTGLLAVLSETTAEAQ